MDDNNVYVTKTLIEKTGLDELDFELYDEFNFNRDDNDDFIEIIKGGWGRADTHPIKIDKLIDKLQELKSKGSTHVELDYHNDHVGYDIDGYTITLSDQKDIEEYQEKQNKEQEKQSKIQELENQIRIISKS